MKRRRASNRLPDTAQTGLPLSSPAARASHIQPAVPVTATRFAPEQEVYFGAGTLESYLRATRQDLPVLLRGFLRELDMSVLLGEAKETGRKPIHPRVFMGLVTYGMLSKQSSLRDLERLARVDLGAIYLCGGLQPDHSTIGKFISEHEEALSEGFYVEMTTQLARRLGVKAGAVAIDGTTIQAAASAYRAMKLEAAREVARELAERAQQEPENARLQASAQTAHEAVVVGALRESAREGKGNKAPVQVCPAEPDAVIQPLKNELFAPSYKPTVCVHESGLIVGQAVDGSSEMAHLATLLAQQEQVVGEKATMVLLDAGFHNETTFSLCLAREENVLCPAGRESAPEMEPVSKKGKLLKHRFEFDEGRDCYTCPAGQLLVRIEQDRDKDGRRLVTYRAPAAICAVCPLKARCTTSPSRQIKRYEIDATKEAMRQILRHPQARADYRRRSWTVEPSFSRLRGRQGLTRFLRRGLRGVRVEFALHALAHNFGVATRAARRRAARRYAWARRSAGKAHSRRSRRP